jgi:hypothetical protein
MLQEGDDMKLIIRTNKKYAQYLSRHLQEEHPKTKGKIRLRR